MTRTDGLLTLESDEGGEPSFPRIDLKQTSGPEKTHLNEQRAVWCRLSQFSKETTFDTKEIPCPT